MSDEEIYAEIVEELRKNGPKPGLWAMVYSEANGDEKIARAKYMKIRAQQILTQRCEAPTPIQLGANGAAGDDATDGVIGFVATWAYPAILILVAIIMVIYVLPLIKD